MNEIEGSHLWIAKFLLLVFVATTELAINAARSFEIGSEMQKRTEHLRAAQKY